MRSNDIIEKLKNKYETNKLAHAFLIETNNIDKCINDLKKLIKYINCPEGYTNNCSKCNLCHLIDTDNLPSFICIESDGMNIKKDALQELQLKFSTKPVYSRYNIYIIKEASLMNSAASNSILKFLEEPNEHIIGFLITSNKEKMLDTIISRCENIKFYYEEKRKFDEGKKILADEYLNQIFNSKSNYINKSLVLPVIKERDEIKEFFHIILECYLNEKAKNYFPGNNSVDKKSFIIYNKQLEIIKKVIDMINQNVNIELLLDFFVIEMRRSNG